MSRWDEDYDSAPSDEDVAAAKERSRAKRLWHRLEDAADAQARRDLAVGDPDFWSWAVCEKLCHESAEAADDGNKDQACELAELALQLVSKVSGKEHELSRLQECVWAHVSYARRSRGDMEGAGAALARAAEYFSGGALAILPSPIQRERLYLIEAALLRDRGHLNEALKKIKQSFGGVQPDVKVALALEEGRLCRWLGRYEKALQAFSIADRDAHKVSPRLRLRLEIERGFALCDLDRHAEVGPIPITLRRDGPAGPIDKSRLLCVECRTAVGLGQPEKAETFLPAIFASLPDRVVLVEAALLSLELTALYARLGRTADVKKMATETLLPIAEAAPGLPRGAVASLRLFCRLTEQDKMSAERAAQFVRDFPRAPV